MASYKSIHDKILKIQHCHKPAVLCGRSIHLDCFKRYLHYEKGKK